MKNPPKLSPTARALLCAGLMGVSGASWGQACEQNSQDGMSAAAVPQTGITAGTARCGTGDQTVIGASFEKGSETNDLDGRYWGGFAGSYDGVTTANNNRLTVRDAVAVGGLVAGQAFGHDFKGSDTRHGTGANANGNKLEVMNIGTVSGNVYGGHAETNTGQATANNNQITVQNVHLTGIDMGGGIAISNLGNAEANGNTVKLVNIDMVTGNIFGGAARFYTSPVAGNATANNNTLSVTGGSVNHVYGVSLRMNNSSGVGTANSNRTTLEGVDVSGNARGVFVAQDVNNQWLTVNNNQLTLTGVSHVGGSVTGVGFSGTSPGNRYTATNNLVTIQDVNTLDIGGGLFGVSFPGALPSASQGTVIVDGTPREYDFFTGNTLTVRNVGQIKVGGNFAHFEIINFYLPEQTQTYATTHTPLIRIAGNANLVGSKIGVAVDGANPLLQPGDSLVLMDVGGTLLTDNTLQQTKGLHGSTYDYTFAIARQDNQIVTTVTERTLRQDAKAHAEGFLGGTAQLVAGSDFAAGTGITSAVHATKGTEHEGLSAFGAVGFNSTRHNTGSHVDVSGWNLIAGAAKRLTGERTVFTVGGFFEYGTADYDTYNSFANARVRGTGDTHYTGVGALARLQVVDMIYLDAALHGGKVDNDYKLNNTGAHYSSDTPYLSAHIGVGKQWKLSERLELDTYGRLGLTRQSGDKVQLSSGETIRFDAVTSTRLRAGARLNATLTPTVGLYGGLALEDEFGGKARAKVDGTSIGSPSLRGVTGIMEAGVILKPTQRLTLEAGAQGYTGQRRGIAGTARVKFEF